MSITINTLEHQQAILDQGIEDGQTMPQVLSVHQLDKLLAYLSTEFVFASGTMAWSDMSDASKYGFIVGIQHAREVLRQMTEGV